MKVIHFGQEVDIDPQTAAIHHSVMRYAKRFAPLTERTLWLKVRSRGCSDEQYTAAVDYLVERGLLQRETTNYTNSFLIRVPKPQSRKSSVIRIQEPLTPESC